MCNKFRVRFFKRTYPPLSFICPLPGPPGPWTGRRRENPWSRHLCPVFEDTSALNRAALNVIAARRTANATAGIPKSESDAPKGEGPVFADCAATQVDSLNSARGGPRVPRKFTAATRPLSHLALCRRCRPRLSGCSFRVFTCPKGRGMRWTRFQTRRYVTLLSGTDSRS